MTEFTPEQVEELLQNSGLRLASSWGAQSPEQTPSQILAQALNAHLFRQRRYAKGGLTITLSGPEGCGKSTIGAHLLDELPLRGFTLGTYRFVGGPTVDYHPLAGQRHVVHLVEE